MDEELEYMDEDNYFDECGFSYEHGCQLAGTEFCDWECPFRSEYGLWIYNNHLNT